MGSGAYSEQVYWQPDTCRPAEFRAPDFRVNAVSAPRQAGAFGQGVTVWPEEQGSEELFLDGLAVVADGVEAGSELSATFKVGVWRAQLITVFVNIAECLLGLGAGKGQRDAVARLRPSAVAALYQFAFVVVTEDELATRLQLV